jgi:hypothetical protein
MNRRFQRDVEQLEPKFKQLISMSPVTIATLPRVMPDSGVYLLSEKASHLYVGRSRRLRQRLRYHCADRYREASFAFSWLVRRLGVRSQRTRRLDHAGSCRRIDASRLPFAWLVAVSL